MTLPDVMQAEEGYREQGKSVKKKTVVSGNYRP
jgi:hypothetical protein